MTKPKNTKKPTNPTTPTTEYVIVRCRNAGVHAGVLVKVTSLAVYLRDARRIWKWSGAMELNELATYGAAKPDECKFGTPVTDHRIMTADVCEIIVTQDEGERMIRGVKPWRFGK